MNIRPLKVLLSCRRQTAPRSLDETAHNPQNRKFVCNIS